MKKIVELLLVVMLVPGSLSARELPEWREARAVMTECYSGWNGTIEVSAGLGSEIRSDRYEEFSYDILDERSSMGSLSRSDIMLDGEITSTESRSAEQDLYENTSASIGDSRRERVTNKAFVGLTMTVPIYSREVRLKRQEATADRVEHLADLYAQHQAHRATAAALREETKLMRKVMIEDGYQSIRVFYGLLADIEKSKALEAGAKRKIMTILEGCGYVGKSRTTRKR